MELCTTRLYSGPDCSKANVGETFMSHTKGGISLSEFKALHETMLLIRNVESTLAKVFANGEVPGFIHLSIGQEAVAAGVGCAIEPGDTLATTHRGHGHVLAMGIDLEGFFKEIYGRNGGVCRGRGGSMHVSDMSLGIIGANGIVGAGIPIALGSSLALRARGTGGVSVALFGDGAMAEGVLHESMNFAKLLKLPLLLVCENNGWSEFSPTDRQFSGSLAGLSAAFNITHECVDGNDVEAVWYACKGAIKELRDGHGPFVLECVTHRVRGHFEGDPQKYRQKTEPSSMHDKDPLIQSELRLKEMGFTEEDLIEMNIFSEKRVAAALLEARSDVEPDFAEAFHDVHTPVSREML